MVLVMWHVNSSNSLDSEPQQSVIHVWGLRSEATEPQEGHRPNTKTFFYKTITWAMLIHFSMILALCWVFSSLLPRMVLTTHLVRVLNWEMVARIVGAKCLFSFLSLWDQMQPRQWWGTTFLNSCWNKRGMDSKGITEALWDMLSRTSADGVF